MADLGHDSLRALLALRDAATPGDWHIDRGMMSKSLWITCWWREHGRDSDGPIASVSTERYVTDRNRHGDTTTLTTRPVKKAEADAALIVAAVNALPHLVKALLGDERVDESAWLIEWPANKYNPLRYYAAGEQAVMNVNDATRFARKCDAEAVSRGEKLQGARICEHLWMRPAPCGTRPQGGDDLSAPFTSDAVPAQQGGAQ